MNLRKLHLRILLRLLELWESFTTALIKNPKIIVLIIFIALSVFLKVHEVKTGLQDEFYGSDPYAYHEIASKIVNEGDFPANVFNPLEILYLTLVYFVFGVSQLTARIIQIIASFLISFFLYKFTKKYFGETAGFIAAILVLIEPHMVYYSAHLWAEFWVIFCLSLLLYIYAKNADKEYVKRRTFFYMGLVGAIGAFGKLWVLAAAMVLMAFLLWNINKGKIRLAFKLASNYVYFFTFICAVFIIVLPWSIFASLNSGYPIIINSNSNINFYLGNNPRGEIAMVSIYDYSYAENTRIEEGLCRDLMYNTSNSLQNYYLDKCLGKYTKKYIAEHPGKFIGKLYRFTKDYWLLPNMEWYQREIRTPTLRIVTHWFLFVFAVIGFLVSLQKWKEFIPYYLILLGIWLSYAVTVFLGRYKSSNAPFTIIFAAAGMYTFYYIVFSSKKKE